MLAKRIVPCLDVKDQQVVKGVAFRNHEVVGDIVELAQYYSDEGADELVFYDITASPDGRSVNLDWVERVARVINIPFCVAGGIRSIETAENVLNRGADKISVNTPALEDPDLIDALAKRFGTQCVVVGIDSRKIGCEYGVHKNTGDPDRTERVTHSTASWLKEVQERGAGEIVLNCMNQDGVRNGFDLEQLSELREICRVPMIASGGAGNMEHFSDVFETCDVSGALAATVFHKKHIAIDELKTFLSNQNIAVRV
ncbi:MAG: imidazole glycerol phosphate synthase subunit HisF [Gammaproteobacteria bacterium]